MSLNGMQPESVGEVGSQVVLKPKGFRVCRIPCASPTQAAAGLFSSATAIAGFNPEGRKKFISAAETHGAPVVVLKPQGAAPAPTASGPDDALEVGSPSAVRQFCSRKSPRVVLALIGRLRWRPPL